MRTLDGRLLSLEGMATAGTAGPYRPRHPERTVLYRVLAQHFERFVQVYDERFAPTRASAPLC